MILSDKDIKNRIQENNLEFISEKYDIFQQIGPASLDFRLGYDFKFYDKTCVDVIDPRKSLDEKNIKIVSLEEGEDLIVHPGQFILGTTFETIGLPDDIVARCEGRSSLGRLGLIIHSTAGFVDPGFKGKITLEITNINEIPIKLHPGMRVGQFAFHLLSSKCVENYANRKSSKYMNQNNVQESKIFDDNY
ncbi:dCTP deaminase [Candidatus Absconditicoccus praedator]|uniref:dCTP deaminase n=1 Tax=Candidatus Absconditicoccus praedator TaxID=2735562 RepID=UPI001E2E58AB|nr:dCTP deaminase [Candidatus Absconditicoccus praedator]UFX82979.1 dCTP deaminase [Candidatus Absconditicoccus praedator]